MRTLRQVVEVIHPGLAGVSKKDLQEKLCKMYKVRQRQAATSQPYATPQHLPVERWPHVPGVAAFSVCGPLCDGSVHRTPCSAPSRTLLPPHTSAPRLLEREVSASAAPTRPAGAGQQLLLAVRLQGCLRWRPEHRVRYDLRQPRGCQEVRAQVPPHTGAPPAIVAIVGRRGLRRRVGGRGGLCCCDGGLGAAVPPPHRAPLLLRSLVWARRRPPPASSARRGRTVPRRRAPDPDPRPSTPDPRPPTPDPRAPRHACSALLAQPPHAYTR